MRRMITGKQIESLENLSGIVTIQNDPSYLKVTDPAKKGEIDISSSGITILHENSVGVQSDNVQFGGNDSLSFAGVYDESGEPKYYLDITNEDGVAISYYDANQDEIYYVIKCSAENGLVLPSIPTSNPGVAGAVWNDNGTLKISSGS